jgi:hypothetical protein
VHKDARTSKRVFDAAIDGTFPKPPTNAEKIREFPYHMRILSIEIWVFWGGFSFFSIGMLTGNGTGSNG